MTLAETIYHSLYLPEPAVREVPDFIQFIEQRYRVTAADTLPQTLTPEQRAAYARLLRLQTPQTTKWLGIFFFSLH